MMFCVFKFKEEGEEEGEQTKNIKIRKIAEFEQSISLEGCAGQDRHQQTFAENKQLNKNQEDSSTKKLTERSKKVNVKH